MLLTYISLPVLKEAQFLFDGAMHVLVLIPSKRPSPRYFPTSVSLKVRQPSEFGSISVCSLGVWSFTFVGIPQFYRVLKIAEHIETV